MVGSLKLAELLRGLPSMVTHYKLIILYIYTPDPTRAVPPGGQRGIAAMVAEVSCNLTRGTPLVR